MSDDSEPVTEEACEVPFDDVVCEHCGSERLVLVESVDKPEWKQLLGYRSVACPFWYDDVRAKDDEEFWDAAMGRGFNAWYLEYIIEGAKETEGVEEQPRPRHTQPLLPGISQVGGYLIDSF